MLSLTQTKFGGDLELREMAAFTTHCRRGTLVTIMPNQYFHGNNGSNDCEQGNKKIKSAAAKAQ